MTTPAPLHIILEQCGNGFKDDELDDLQQGLVAQHMQKFGAVGIPPWLDIAKSLCPGM